MEKQLDNIEFYKLHPSLKPFVGKKYEANELGKKILLVGESHYVKEPLPEITSDSLLTAWWTETPPQIYDTSWYNTRGTVSKFMSGESFLALALFREPCKVYNQCVYNSKYQNRQDICNIFDEFAFMNYFQLPALYERISLWNSLLKFNGEIKKPCGLSDDIWKKTAEESYKVFLKVVDVLKPDNIIFLSSAAYNAFCTSQKKDKEQTFDMNKISATVHPTCPWWNRKKKDGLSGKGK